MVMDPLLKINHIMSDTRRVCRRTAAMFDVIAQKDEMADSIKAGDVQPLRRAIKVKDLSFEYQITAADDGRPSHEKSEDGPVREGMSLSFVSCHAHFLEDSQSMLM